MRTMRQVSLPALIALLVSCRFIMAGAIIEEKAIDGRPSVVLENQLIRAVFTPSQGGSCTDLVFKPTDRRLIPSMTGSLLGSRVWNYADAPLYWQWQRATWATTLERRPGEVRLVLSAMGEADFTRACRFEKRVTLRDAESMLRVTHSFHVGAELMTPRKIGLWFHNKVSVPGERTVYFLPLEDGVRTLDFGAGATTGWFYNPARGWLALKGESGAGLTFNVEYKRLMCFYVHARAQPTLEWAFRTQDVGNGDTFSTDQLIVPFEGFRRVHGSANGVVAAFEAPDKVAPDKAKDGLSLKARLTAGTPVSGVLRITARRMPDGRVSEAYKQPIALKPGEVVSVPFTVSPDQPGTWLLSGVLSQEKTPIMDFVKPIRALEAGKDDEGEVAAQIPPLEKRLGRAEERFEDRKPLAGVVPKDLSYTTKIESPHVKWARPLAGKKLRVLVLTSCLNAREGAELAQRLDMEIVWVTAGAPNELGRMGYLFGAGTRYLPEHMNANIKKALATPLDAIVIGSMNASYFSEEVIETLKKKVSEGTGLVYVTPVGGTEALYDFLPVEKATHTRHRNGKWRAIGAHFITGGVPFEVLPRTDYVTYEDKEDLTTELIAKLGDHPLIVAQDGPDDGRIVVFSYNTGWQGSGGYKSGMTPWIEKRDTGLPYWEYTFAILAKAVVWAAQREPEIQLTASTGRLVNGRPEIEATFENGGGAAMLNAEITLRDAYGRVEWQDQREVSVKQGEATISLPLPAETAGGLHVADLIFRDAEGNSVAWGAASVTVEGAIVIESVTTDRPAYRAGDTIRASVKLRPAKGKGETEALLTARLTDGLGRLIGQQELPVTVQGETAADTQFTLREPLVTAATIRVEAKVGGRVSAVAEHEVITFPRRFVERSWGDDWAVAVWGSAGGSYGRKYLAAVRAQRFKDFGVSVVLASPRWTNEREYRDQVRSGFQIMPMGAAFGYINVLNRVPKGKLTYKQQVAEYNKTHDRKYLERPISLSDPKDLEALAEKLHVAARYIGWVEPIGYNLGDELSITDHVTPFDYDFGPAALDAFREWLKTQYASLKALNAQWGTDFSTWNAVRPMTAHEVKGRGNYSPWADHRAFMDATFVNFFKWTRDQLRREDPKATVGLSGSQAAEAYGGYNWPLLAAELDFAQTYTVANTEIMHRSFAPGLPRATWHGYGARNPGVRYSLWYLLFQGSHGISYYASDSMYNPDQTYGPTAADMAPIIKEFQSGVARLVRNARRISLIGMHYSHASIRGAYISGAAWRLSQDRAGWLSVMNRLGFQCEFLPAAQLEAGELLKRDYPAFILPYSVAVSDKEAAELRRYVEGGGLLIADGKAGLLDERCGPRKRGALDDLFGVKRPSVNPLTPLRAGTAEFTQDLEASNLKGLDFSDKSADPDLALAGGQALGTLSGAPIFIVRKLGKGTAVLTNFFLDSYSQRVKLGAESPFVEVVRSALALGEVRPIVTVHGEGTPTPRAVSTVCYASGDALFAGTILSGSGQGADWSAKLIFSFPKEGNLYDVREGQFVGRGRTAEKRLLTGDAALFALMPYRVERVVVGLEQPAYKGGEAARYSIKVGTDGGGPGPGVFRIEVTGPDGQPRTHYSTNLTASDGQAAGSLQTALNDAPGTWTIKATDYVSRVVGTATFGLK